MHHRTSRPRPPRWEQRGDRRVLGRMADRRGHPPGRHPWRSRMSSPLPTPVAAALGLVPTILDGVRRLPGTAVRLPVLAVGNALATSERLRREYGELADRGERLVGRLAARRRQRPSRSRGDGLEGRLANGRAAVSQAVDGSRTRSRSSLAGDAPAAPPPRGPKRRGRRPRWSAEGRAGPRPTRQAGPTGRRRRERDRETPPAATSSPRARRRRRRPSPTAPRRHGREPEVAQAVERGAAGGAAGSSRRTSCRCPTSTT